MSNTIHEHDFVLLDYTGRVPSGAIFDTTLEALGRQIQLPNPQHGFRPVTICVGEHQLLPGLDAHLIGKECGQTYTISLKAEEAFGKRDIKNVKIVPMSSFKEHKVQPYPGLKINLDDEVGVVKSVSGGRVIVNFNHALAGQDVICEVTLHQKITDIKHQIQSFFQTSLKLAPENVHIKEDGDKVHVELAIDLPQPILDAMSTKLMDLVKSKIVIASTKRE